MQSGYCGDPQLSRTGFLRERERERWTSVRRSEQVDTPVALLQILVEDRWWRLVWCPGWVVNRFW